MSVRTKRMLRNIDRSASARGIMGPVFGEVNPDRAAMRGHWAWRLRRRNWAVLWRRRMFTSSRAAQAGRRDRAVWPSCLPQVHDNALASSAISSACRLRQMQRIPTRGHAAPAKVWWSGCLPSGELRPSARTAGRLQQSAAARSRHEDCDGDDRPRWIELVSFEIVRQRKTVVEAVREDRRLERL